LLRASASSLEEIIRGIPYSLDFPGRNIKLTSTKRNRLLRFRTAVLKPLNWGRNAKILIATETLGGIPLSWILFYRPIFLKEAIGLSEVQIGLLSTVTIFSSILLPIAGGYLGDKFGRKRTLILFDSLSWIPSFTIWIVTHDLWYALAAYILESLSYIAFSPWECLLVEDTTPEERSGLYGYTALIYNIGRFSTPIAGCIIGMFGVNSGVRILFAIGLASIALMIVIRQAYLRETEVGYQIMKEKKMAGLAGYLSSLSIIRKNRIIAVLLFSFTVSSLYYSIGIYTSLFLIAKNGLGLSEDIASWMPSAASISSVILNLFIVPRLMTRSSYSKALILGHLFGSIGLILLICSPKGILYPILISGFLLGIYQVSAFSVSKTFLTNEIEIIDPKARAKILSVTTTLSSLVSLPIPTLAGYLFTLEPRLPFLLASLSITLGLVVIALATRKIK